jgi:two-component system sensor histidine kinase CreC
MRDALDGRSYVQNYVETLTHEMKSPVAAIRGAAELLREESMPAGDRQKFLGNIQAEAGRIQTIIDRLLGLSALFSRSGQPPRGHRFS